MTIWSTRVRRRRAFTTKCSTRRHHGARRVPVPRLDHTTMVLLPDASVLIAGSDRTELLPDDLIPRGG